MNPAQSTPLSGRRAETARAVFLADADAPIAAVAERAGVGIGALYRRYRSKDELLQRLVLDGLRAYVAAAALADDDDPWEAFGRVMRRSLEVGAGSLTVRFAGSFTPTEDLHRLGRNAYEVTQRLVDRTKASGVLRPEIEVGDIELLLEQLQAVQVADQDRTRELRHRYLTLLLDGLHAPAPAPLPGAAPAWAELSGRYGG